MLFIDSKYKTAWRRNNTLAAMLSNAVAYSKNIDSYILGYATVRLDSFWSNVLLAIKAMQIFDQDNFFRKVYFCFEAKSLKIIVFILL